ncbi:DsbA family oxidoreductase [Acinetobacter tianfuensis]|uniref:DsbA family oxidoreductase n=1 Tax=Acinetobacter tianfuensis TaxID=2419603 RepID=A0A3A8E734_9GAMM|nr:DsbA family oxidoreductase [Acinetobacter tianfuensis]RKG30637.1 DsbA family oxidoreductase [Acinetobacter tianfuensis]
MKSMIDIEVYFDFICPWCLIGKRQLQVAIQQLKQTHPNVEVNIKWRGVQLLPSMPIEGIPFKAFYLQRLGTSMAVRLRQEQVRQAAKAVGVEIDFERIPRMPNTAKAHSLLSHAAELADAAQHDLLLEGIFSAYFHHSENISDTATLERIATYCGYNEAQIKAILNAPNVSFVSANTGGKGVPYFVFDRTFALAGAQPAAMLYQAMLESLEVQEAKV